MRDESSSRSRPTEDVVHIITSAQTHNWTKVVLPGKRKGKGGGENGLGREIVCGKRWVGGGRMAGSK